MRSHSTRDAPQCQG